MKKILALSLASLLTTSTVFASSNSKSDKDKGQAPLQSATTMQQPQGQASMASVASVGLGSLDDAERDLKGNDSINNRALQEHIAKASEALLKTQRVLKAFISEHSEKDSKAQASSASASTSTSSASSSTSGIHTESASSPWVRKALTKARKELEEMNFTLETINGSNDAITLLVSLFNSGWGFESSMDGSIDVAANSHRIYTLFSSYRYHTDDTATYLSDEHHARAKALKKIAPTLEIIESLDEWLHKINNAVDDTSETSVSYLEPEASQQHIQSTTALLLLMGDILKKQASSTDQEQLAKAMEAIQVTTSQSKKVNDLQLAIILAEEEFTKAAKGIQRYAYTQVRTILEKREAEKKKQAGDKKVEASQQSVATAAAATGAAGTGTGTNG